ncbi:[protein-PII] uridylyltransferase [Methylovirgula ligni]|uniref:Bifunctional uridylyltransferase/uridylyl-removing enzyme n=1 Tax=Methylovirgula ligni TaxID=569860 RepID=A0A3D9YPS7_9HYPH|nr:[protein-PII] uridylyltransferase [Methylovirgula ligni]QAY95006.1 [protein-PII] uridylyltransferase [Methylovirgula ligni]REF84534.1 UTP--GlnB (protein PII) uridylyltransferase GlnD [Methylovirgula ligni]
MSLSDLVPPLEKPRRQATAIPLAQLFDRAKIGAEIAKAHAEGLAGDALRRQALELFRAGLDSGRERAQEVLFASGGGLACATNLSKLEDELIRALYDFSVTYLYPAPDPNAPCLVVAAVGGYGRATLAPGSDIDLLFLLPSAEDAWGKHVTESMLYLLWDLKQKVGHSTRCVEECLVQSRRDMTIRTALLEARFILGDEKLFDDMCRRFDKEIVHRSPREFVVAKLEERDTRISKAGQSRYLVEPNVKEGKGGLRDLNSLFWIAKYVYRVRQASDLVDAGLFTRREYRLFCRCEEFLWRVRCHLHFITGRAEEILSFDLQRPIAERLGYAGRGGLSGVERFMKHYFLIAKEVGDLTAVLSAALEERHAKPAAVLDRFHIRVRRQDKLIKEFGFLIENGRLKAGRPDVLDHDPVNMIRMFWLADRYGVALHPDLMHLAISRLHLIDSNLRDDPEANQLFLDVLSSRNSPEVVLRLMNEAGVLGRFIPPFGRIVAMMQFNMYHHYTVDEHLLRAVGYLADIDAQRHRDDLPLTNTIMASIEKRRVLCVAVFLHDIAKGRTEDHSIAGAAVARHLCPRLGLTPAETETVAWLIENHLVMSDTAQRRDLADQRTIETFAARVQTIERLKMLFVLTVCDIQAVGPGVWNGWKGELLRTLFLETQIVLGGGHTKTERTERIQKAKAELRAQLPNWTDADFEAYAARHSQAYWLRVDLPRKIRHAQLLNQTEIDLPDPIIDIRTDAFRAVTEITLIAIDHPRLLAIVAGSCAATGANIVDAQIFTSNDGLAVDTFFISRTFERDEDEIRRGERIALAIEQALRGQIRLAEILAAKHAAAAKDTPFDVPAQVSIDNELSNRYTVIEVSGRDRPGLLYAITDILSQLNLNIASAHIVTFGEKAADVFYVTDLTGAKITTSGRRAAIRQKLLTAFPGQAATKAGAAGKSPAVA